MKGECAANQPSDSSLIPESYSNHITSDLTATVKEESNTFDWVHR